MKAKPTTHMQDKDLEKAHRIADFMDYFVGIASQVMVLIKNNKINLREQIEFKNEMEKTNGEIQNILNKKRR